MVKAVAVTPSTSAHEMIRELVDDEANAVSPSGGCLFIVIIMKNPILAHLEFQCQY